MAFLRFSRDKRGYEHFYLMQPATRGKAPPRVLYWFRTPPNIKVGRAPFDPEIRRALEAQNPDVAFDWESIVETPIPPPVEPERWRERRRLERAMRTAEIEERAEAGDREAKAEVEVVPVDAKTMAVSFTDTLEGPSTTAEPIPPAHPLSPTSGSTGESRGRRRRRRRRGRHGDQVQGSGVQQVQEAQGVQGAQESATRDSEHPADEKLEP